MWEFVDVVDPKCVWEQRQTFQDENYRHERRAKNAQKFS